MRNLILIVFLITSITLRAQNLYPNSISTSYFGETASHPGLKIGVNYQLKSWDKNKLNKNENVAQKRVIEFSPSIGFYYHTDYQTGIFVLPELSYSRQNKKGNFMTYGFGAGYLRALIPNVYDINSNSEIKKNQSGNNYFITNYSISFIKDLSYKKNLPIKIFIKPQLMHAVPNYSGGVLYFALELGVCYELRKK